MNAKEGKYQVPFFLDPFCQRCYYPLRETSARTAGNELQASVRKYGNISDTSQRQRNFTTRLPALLLNTPRERHLGLRRRQYPILRLTARTELEHTTQNLRSRERFLRLVVLGRLMWDSIMLASVAVKNRENNKNCTRNSGGESGNQNIWINFSELHEEPPCGIALGIEKPPKYSKATKKQKQQNRSRPYWMRIPSNPTPMKRTRSGYEDGRENKRGKEGK